MMRDVIATKEGPQAIGPYSQAIRVNGFIFVSGQVAIDPANQQFIAGDVAAQTDRAIKNLAGILKAAGSSLEKVVRATVFLKNMSDFAAMNEVYGKYFGSAPPATSTVDLAGGAEPKYFPYTSFIAAKSLIFFRKTVARTTFSRLLPAAFRMPARFFIARSVCAATSPAMNCWFAGSIATCPDTKMNPFTRIACEYGPIACGPSLVAITSRIIPR